MGPRNRVFLRNYFVFTDRLGKKPGFFVGVRPGVYLSVAKARQALMSAEVSSEKSSRISASVMPPARYSKMS